MLLLQLLLKYRVLVGASKINCKGTLNNFYTAKTILVWQHTEMSTKMLESSTALEKLQA